MIKYKTIIIIFISTFFVSACTHTTYWAKPGGTRFEFDATQAKCHNQAYLIPEVKPELSPPNYYVETTVSRNVVNSTVTPYKTPYQNMADALSSTSADFGNIVRHEMHVENCMASNGWTKIDGSALAITVDAYAIRQSDGVSYSGTATGHADRTGTIKIAGEHGEICVGSFRYTSNRGGDGIIRCNDGQSAEIIFTALSNTKGYGSGSSGNGENVLFIYGMSREEGKQYLTLK